MHTQQVGDVQRLNRHLQLLGHLRRPLPVRGGPTEWGPSMWPVGTEVRPGQVARLEPACPHPRGRGERREQGQRVRSEAGEGGAAGDGLSPLRPQRGKKAAGG